MIKKRLRWVERLAGHGNGDRSAGVGSSTIVIFETPHHRWESRWSE